MSASVVLLSAGTWMVTATDVTSFANADAGHPDDNHDNYESADDNYPGDDWGGLIGADG